MRAAFLALLGGLAAAATSRAAELVPVVPFPGAASTTVYSINARGQVAGTYADADGHQHGFFGHYYGDYTSFDVGTGGTVARGISDTGYITGYSNSEAGDAGAQPMWVRKPTGKVFTVTRRGETLFGFSNGIEFSRNAFAGAYWDSGLHHSVAFVGHKGKWAADVQISAVHQASSAYGINARGVVVGSYFTPPEHGFVSVGDTFTPVDYTDPRAVSTVLMSVDADNVAVGQWRDRKGFAHSFLYNIDGGTFTDINVKGANDVQAWGIGNTVVVLSSDIGQFYWCRRKAHCPVGGD